MAFFFSPDVFQGLRSKAARRLPSDVRAVALRKLDMLNAARSLQDLMAPPGNRLEPLRDDLRGYHSIRVNDQWRVVFRWTSGEAHEVRIADYH